VPDFKTGVTAVLKTKLKGRPAWSPASLAEVDGSNVEQKFFHSKDAHQANLLVPDFARERAPKDFLKFALPREQDIMRLVKGEDTEGTGLALTLDDLLHKVDKTWGFKPGSKRKTLEIVDRKCALEDGKYLRWK